MGTPLEQPNPIQSPPRVPPRIPQVGPVLPSHAINSKQTLTPRPLGELTTAVWGAGGTHMYVQVCVFVTVCIHVPWVCTHVRIM